MVDIPSAKELLSQVKTAATDVLSKDITLIVGYSEYQLNHIAQHAVLLAKAGASGAFKTEADRQEFLDGLREMIENFLATLSGLLVITIEKLWNAMVKVFWDVLGKALQVVLPIPKFPATLAN